MSSIPLSPLGQSGSSRRSMAEFPHGGGRSRVASIDALSRSSSVVSVVASDLPAPAPATFGQRIRNLFVYQTSSIVRVRSMKVSFLHIGFQLLILAYILVFSIYIKKGYQRTDAAEGSSGIKVKGTAYLNGSMPWLGPNAPQTFMLYDVYDLQTPPVEVNAAFITSNMWMTLNQTRGTCTSYNSACSETEPCQPLKMTEMGVQIGGPGTCRINQSDPTQPWPITPGGYCEVFAWCPVENEVTVPKSDAFRLHGVDEFTVFARMDIHYPALHQHLDNSGSSSTVTPGLNLWSIEEMVQLAGYEWADVNDTGLILAMQSVWDCDFDADAGACTPDISFVRLDSSDSKLSSGFNFRTVEYLHDQWGSRELTKHYGIRLILLMSGVGSQSDIVVALTTLGAGISLLSIATLLADFVSTRLLTARARYRSAKFREVKIADPALNLLAPFDQLARATTQAARDVMRHIASSDDEPKPEGGAGEESTEAAL